MSLEHNLSQVKQRLEKAARRAGRDPAEVRLVAVSKLQPPEAVRQAWNLGQTRFGENYVQEAQAKIAELGSGPEWHLTGRLQSNKAKIAVKLFSMIHSLHSLELAQALNAALDKALQAGQKNSRLPVLIQVNIGQEKQKSGCPPQELPALASAVAKLPYLELKGLMTLPPYFDQPEKARPFFRQLRELAQLLAPDLPAGSMDELSMGMSGDFEAAVEEGATLVRVGTAIFGER